jgi:NAD(P)-dependent dehydrogenase (short-subunit alcohol dehydrogenase family)
MKVVLTGGNRGIGLALTQRFLEEGYEVTVLCRQSSPELSQGPAKVIEGIDVTNQESLQKAAQEVGDCDILISNAGVLIGDSFETLNFEDLQTQIEVNTYGPLKLVKAFEKNLKKGAKIGIITSRMGSISDNTSGGQYGYRLSKAGANALSKSLAEDFRDRGVTVLILHPGYVKTEMTGGRGLIDTRESAQGLYKILKEKTHEQTGTFWHTNGEELPW